MRTQISAELSLLARQRASGALEILGNPGGTVFLSGGYLTYAESPAIPDLRTRLIRSQRISAGQWNEIIASDGDRGGVGALLVSGDVVSRSELRKLLWSVALDALVALTLPVRAGPLGGGPLGGVRFWPRRSPWVGSLLRLDVASVCDDVSEKAERLTRREIPAEGCPQLRPMAHPWAVVKSEQWAVAWQLDGLATVRDVAWRNGYALYDTLEWVGDLVQAGVCTVVPPAGVAPAVTALPLRQRGESLADGSDDAEIPVVPKWRAEDVPKPPGTSHPDLLHRILGGLRRDDLMPAAPGAARLGRPVDHRPAPGLPAPGFSGGNSPLVFSCG